MPTLRTLLKDPIYKAWFLRLPTEAKDPTTPPWYVYVQKEEGGAWGRKEFWTYKEALRFAAAKAKTCHDVVVNSKRRAYPPPMVKQGSKKTRWPGANPPGLLWCPYCRRPTRFRFYKRHHAIPKHMIIVPYIKRCEICGVKSDFIRRYT